MNYKTCRKHNIPLQQTQWNKSNPKLYCLDCDSEIQGLEYDNQNKIFFATNLS